MRSRKFASGDIVTNSDEPNAVGSRFSSDKAFRHFATYEGKTQSQQHIKPLHEYVTCRLVLEGGFQPDEIKPHPPLRIDSEGKVLHLIYDRDVVSKKEATLLGGLKTKNVDIVVSKPEIGPVLAVSCKGMTGAIRNLTNRLEETIGECTNIHIAYPTLVFGYLFLLRANRSGSKQDTDIAIDDDDNPVESVNRFHQALCGMTGRASLRDDPSKYESISLALIEVSPQSVGSLNVDFPPPESPTVFDNFFATIYRQYDERYVVSAPLLAHRTRRVEWDHDSPAFESIDRHSLDYSLRLKP